MGAAPEQATTPHASYAYKATPLGAIWRFRLAPDAIEWEAGPRRGHLPYADIRRLRLSFRPVSMQSHRFLAEIWPSRGAKLQMASSSWRSMVDHESHEAAYTGFVLELHRRLAAAQVATSFECGSTALRYWPGLVIFAGVALGLAALTAQALAEGAWMAAAMVGGVLSVFLWQAGTFFRRNRPGTYAPQTPPRNLLP
ncbi:MAG TPA: hypothetical protein VH249_13345 [Xanthobacteraceae bacterium]|jgi:hypothetical protein|nr:hypothetical protein [Xanthobacteraceae bacterium]